MVSSCVLGFPLVSKVTANGTYFTFATMTGFSWLPILDGQSWKARTVEFRSPLGVRVRAKRWIAGASITLWPTCAEDTILKVAARHGFWDIPLTGLRQLARELMVDVGAADGLPATHLLVAEAVLHPKRNLTASEKLEILRFRLPSSDAASEFLQSEEVDELLDAKTKEELRQDIPASSGAAVAPDVKSAIADLAKEVHAGGKKGGSGSAPSSGPAAKKQRKYPARIRVEDTITPEGLSVFLPDECTISACALDQCWRLRAYGQRVGSKAWALHGRSQGATMLIKLAWEIAVSSGREPKCPFSDLSV